LSNSGGSLHFCRDQLFFFSIYSVMFGIVSLMIFFVHHWGTFWITAYFSLLLYFSQILVYLLGGLIWSWSFRVSTILPAVRGNTKSRLTLTIVLIVKTATELIILFSLITLVQQLVINQKSKTQVATWSSLQTRYSPSLSLDITGKEQLSEDRQTYKLVKWATNHHGLISNYAGYNSDGGQHLNFENYTDYYNGGNVLMVNAEYFKQNKVVSKSGSSLIFYPDDSKIHILFPQKLSNKKKELTKMYTEQMGLQHFFENNHKVPQVKTHLMKNNQLRYTYSPAGIDLGYYDAKVPDPVIIVISPESLNGDNENADRLWNAMLSNNAFSFKNYGELNQKLVSLGMYKQIGAYTNIKSYAGKIYHDQEQKVTRLIVILGLMIGLLVFECFLACSLYFGIYQQAQAVRIFMGQSLVKVHYKFALLLSSLLVGELILMLNLRPGMVIVMEYYIAVLFLSLSILLVKSKLNVANIKNSLRGEL
ncbi:hypothetical protein, partial [Levilactobacillus senmaizukei]|uniref:hypothetical protein n=1 Tax=Levilactobacillus senmaizukei TaxID=431273 RepID=UPI0007819C00